MPRTGEGTGPPGFEEPSFGQRLLARLVDVLVLLPALAVVTVVFDDAGEVVVRPALVAVYEVAMVARYGRTLGKMLFGTLIVDRTSGDLPTARQAVLRWAVLGLGPVADLVADVVAPDWSPLTSLWWLVVLAPAMRPPLHRGLHDRASSTVVTSTMRV